MPTISPLADGDPRVARGSASLHGAFDTLSYWLAAAVILLVLPLSAAASVETAIKQRVTSTSAGQKIGGAVIAAERFITGFYAGRGYRPAWHGRPAAEQLEREIAESVEHGFRPEDFHAEALAALGRRAESGDPAAIAEYEIVASDAAIRLLHHIYFGKVDPEALDPNWNFGRQVVPGDPVEIVTSFVDAGHFSGLVDDVALKHRQYLRMQQALRDYRELEQRGGWPAVPEGEVLRLGDEDARVGDLRSRLIVTGELAASAETGTTFDETLDAAVRRFQERHGIEADGIVGPATLRALNTPVSARIEQLRLSLERARWTLRDLDGDFVLVNIGGATTYLFRDGRVVWRTRSIVGKAYRKTPVFRDEIRYMEFNPTWTVPVSIFRRDKLSRIRRDPGYLARNGFSVRNTKGRNVDPSRVNWSSKNPRVTLVQKPGPKNALGLVKFMFPNKHAVYLHDTDDRSLFNRAERNFSSGCVRIEDPFVFADLLMEGAPDWSAERREAILASGRTTRIDLPEPLPVLLTYYTAWVEDGVVQFRNDVYERDGRLSRALAAPFVLP